MCCPIFSKSSQVYPEGTFVTKKRVRFSFFRKINSKEQVTWEQFFREIENQKKKKYKEKIIARHKRNDTRLDISELKEVKKDG